MPFAAPTFRLAARHPLVLGAAFAALLAAALTPGCAKTGDVDRIEQENRVQDQRLRSLEEGMSESLRAQFEKMNAELKDLRQVLEGRTANINERLDQLAAEQKKIAETTELNQNQVRKTDRELDRQVKAFAAYRVDSEGELDKVRLRLRDIEGLMKSPIAGLPASTEPDKVYRDAMFLLVSGQLDLAVDRFGQFMQQYPKEPRRAEALYRQGQAYYLLRKYDFALVPLFEILDKNPQSKFVVEAKWLVARSLEETGDLKLARDFYAQLVNGKTVYSADASRRLAFMNKVMPATPAPKQDAPKPDAAKPDTAKPDAPKSDSPKADAPKPDASEKADNPVKSEAGSKS